MVASVSVLVGTTKGAFILQSDNGREDWAISGPHCDGWPINHMIGDPVSGELWAAGGSPWEGAGIWRSADGGASWTLKRLANGEREDWIKHNAEDAARYGVTAAPPAPFTGQITSIWSLAASGSTLYAGTKPAELFRSDDRGETWTINDCLANYPDRESWYPGAAGLVLHTIVPASNAPEKLWIGISAAGVFATEDAGVTWQHRIRRSNTPPTNQDTDVANPIAPEGGHSIGTCVHNMVLAPEPPSGAGGGAGGELLYQQNHHGVFRSPDGGRGWVEITEGLPSSFGFPIAVHPKDPSTVFVLPLNGDSVGRYPPDAKPAVWRTRDGGETWTACRNGLPPKDCFFTVLRQAMAVDGGDPAGLYFGTNSGSVFATRDEGETFGEIASHLPTVLSVETLSARR